MIRGIGLLDRLVGGLVYGNEIGRVGNLGDLSSSTILGFGARLRIRTLVVRVLGVLEVPWAEIFFLPFFSCLTLTTHTRARGRLGAARAS